jgi:hypothetical protein
LQICQSASPSATSRHAIRLNVFLPFNYREYGNNFRRPVIARYPYQNNENAVIVVKVSTDTDRT